MLVNDSGSLQSQLAHLLLRKYRYVKEQITTGSATCRYCLCTINKCSVPLRLNLLGSLSNLKIPEPIKRFDIGREFHFHTVFDFRT
jgi:hypothetical protein